MNEREAPSPADPAPSEPGVSTVAFVPAQEGACPMCGEEFDDPAAFGRHLGAVHDLHDDEGKATDFGELLVVPVPPAPLEGPALAQFAPPERSREAPSLGRPVGLLVLVIVSLAVLGTMIALTRGGDDDETVVGDSSTTLTTSGPTRAGDASPGTTVPPASGPGRQQTSDPAPPSSSTSSGSGSGSAGAAGPTTTIAPSATTSTTQPPPSGFTAPVARDARVDSCERVRNEWRVTFSWAFVGGSGWEPLAAYGELAGSRYQHTVMVPGRKDSAIATVHVVDAAGRRHAVALQPGLSTASC